MSDELATVLRLVSEGKLSPDEAAPIIEALGRSAPSHAGKAPGAKAPSGEPPSSASWREWLGFQGPGKGPIPGKGRGRRIRIQITERGRRVIDVRVPVAFAAVAARMVPGIPDSYQALIEQAVESDTIGPIVDIAEEEDGDAVLITIE
jgi:hypothetical protein